MHACMIIRAWRGRVGPTRREEHPTPGGACMCVSRSSSDTDWQLISLAVGVQPFSCYRLGLALATYDTIDRARNQPTTSDEDGQIKVDGWTISMDDHVRLDVTLYIYPGTVVAATTTIRLPADDTSPARGNGRIGHRFHSQSRATSLLLNDSTFVSTPGMQDIVTAVTVAGALFQRSSRGSWQVWP